MDRRISNYRLIREYDRKVIFEGSYTKHYLTPYCAIFAEYPVPQTQILVCKRVADDDNGYGFNRCCLVSGGSTGTESEVGKYIPLCEVHTEKEATAAVEANQKAEEELLRILEGR